MTKKFRTLLALVLMVTVMAVMTACSPGQTESDNGKVKVVATLFPQYDFTKQIGGDYVDVTIILPPGVEPHGYEPTPQDVATIEKSDLFVYTGEFMEPWAVKMVETASKTDDQIVVVSQGVTLLKDTDEDHDADEHEDDDHDADDDHDEDHDADEDEHHHGEFDPHIWLSPENAVVMVNNILEKLVAVDPDHKDYYEANAKAYTEKLETLNSDYQAASSGFKTHTLILGGHNAFGYLANAYGLEVVSPYAGFAPDAEPSPQKIAEMVNLMANADTNVIYYEELIEPRVANVISEETGAKMLPLNAAENLSKEDFEAGVTYVDIMNSNLENIKEGLGYEE